MNYQPEIIDMHAFDLVLDREEMEMLNSCASNIRGHLTKLVKKDAKVKYANNLEILDEIMSELSTNNTKKVAF